MRLSYVMLLTLMASHAKSFPSVDRYLSVTTSAMAIKPTRVEMMYYNYYTACIYKKFEAKTMARCYCSKIKDDITEFVVLENSTALVALSEKRKEIVVAYRGSSHWWNWVLDSYILNISPHGEKNIKIHKGFYIAVMSLYERMVKTVGTFRLVKKEFASYKLILTGHSLGGAMARVTQYLLLRLKQFPGMPMEVYTYGEPRSGNKDYVDFLNNQTIKSVRVINGADIVSHLPPTSILGTSIVSDYYYHTTNEYWINGDQEKFASRIRYEDPSSANSYGPQYNCMDHGFYFDVKLSSETNVAQELSVPKSFRPFDILPPFPEPIRNFWSDLVDLGTRTANCITHMHG